jgi:biotin carboxyl carrier protein
MKLTLVGSQKIFDLEPLGAGKGSIKAKIDGEECEIKVQGSLFLSLNNRLALYDTSGMSHAGRQTIDVAVGPSHFEFEILQEGAARRRSGGLASHEVVAPMPGKVLKVIVAEGDEVASGAPLIVLEAMKMETTLYAESAAVIVKIHVAAGAMVDHGAVLIELNPPPAQGPSAPESGSPAS